MAARFKAPRDRRKAAPVKRVAISPEVRQAYEDAMRERDQRDRDHTQHLPDDFKRKR